MTSPAPAAGFGPYQVVRALGQGAMGRVFEVRDPEHPERRLALKQALGELGEQGLTRFRREAELLARVRHPGVVAVHAVGEAPDGPWLLMDLVEGESLGELLRRLGRFEPRDAARIVADLASAVTALHAQGVLHRDLKPDNALLRPDGSPVLIDFGLAWAEDVARLTRTGVVVGSPAFMSPEQAAGVGPGRLDERTDVWSLGAILFMLLCGRPPFSGGGPIAVLQKVQFEPPRWPTRQELGGRALPGPLRRTLEEALAKDPHERPPGAAELEGDLRRFLIGASSGAPTRLLPIAVALAALLVVAIGVALVVKGRARASSAEPQPAPATVETSAPAPQDAPVKPPREGPVVRVLPHGGPALVGARFDASRPITWTGPGAPPGSSAFGLVRSWSPGQGHPDALPQEGEIEALLVQPIGVLVMSVRTAGGVMRRITRQKLDQDHRSIDLPIDVVPPGEAITAMALRVVAAPEPPPAPRSEPSLRRLPFVLRALALAAVAGDGGGARVWLLDFYQRPTALEPLPGLKLALQPEERAVRDLLFLPDGSLLIASERTVAHCVPPRRIESGIKPWRPAAHARAPEEAGPRALALDPGGGRAWAGCQDGTARPVVLAAGTLGDPTRPPHAGPVIALRFTSDGEWLYTLSSAGTGELRCWRRTRDAGWEVVGKVVEWPSPPWTLDLSGDESALLIGLRGEAEVWPIERLRQGHVRHADVPAQR